MQVSSTTEVAVLTAIVAALTYFVSAVGASLPPDVSAGLSAAAAAITAYLSAESLQTTAAAAAAAAPKSP